MNQILGVSARVLAISLVVASVWGAGCAQRRAGRDQRGNGAEAAAQAGRYADPLEASALRERALTLLTELASDPNAQVRGNVLEAMAVTPGRLQALIPAALKDANPGVRATAAMMVGKAGLCDTSAAVRPLLADASPFVRASAIFALTKCRGEIDPTPLAGLLLSDPSPRVRAYAAYLLGEIGEASALGPIHEAAKAPMPQAPAAEVRLMQIQLAEAMVKLGEQDQISTIRAALYPARPEDLECAALAVQVIGQVRDQSSIGELIYLTARQDRTGRKLPAEIRLGCAAALARLGHSEGSFLADEFVKDRLPALRAQAAFTYGEIGRVENLPRLEALMDDPEGIVRVAAAASILKMTASPAR